MFEVLKIGRMSAIAGEITKQRRNIVSNLFPAIC